MTVSGTIALNLTLHTRFGGRRVKCRMTTKLLQTVLCVKNETVDSELL